MTHKEVCGENSVINPCENGGACRVDLEKTTQPFGFICDCPDGWTGHDCTDVDPCGTDPCVNELEENGCINLVGNDYR